MRFKPMLADEANLDLLKFPLLASAKLDGIRAIVIDGVVMSRSLKPIPNAYIQETFGRFEHYDGELIVGSPTSKTCYRDTVSHVMSHDKRDYPVTFHVFDHIEHPALPYDARANRLQAPASDAIAIHRQTRVSCLDHLLEVEQAALDEGYEGLILRDPIGSYKFGRSTAKQGLLLKLKRFRDAEAVVIGFEERLHNGNEATIDELGYTHRSSHAAGKTGLGDLGALVCDYGGHRFNIGTGFDAQERKDIWANRSSLTGRLVKFKYFDYGGKDAPRHPVFLGWRDEIDL